MHAASNTQDWMVAVDIFMQGNHVSYGWWNSSFVVSVVCFVFLLKFPLNEQTLEFLFLLANFIFSATFLEDRWFFLLSLLQNEM